MNDETVKTIAWAVVMITAIQGFTVYCVVRFLATGRVLFQRREPEQEEHSHGFDVIRMAKR